MDKTYRNELHRLFLLQSLPDPMTMADSHLQLFDNYIENTRLRIRTIRIPETKEWTWILQQRFPVGEVGNWKIAEIYLNEDEHYIFENLEGREIRKNRYFFEFDGNQFEIDSYLGDLWGLITAKANFENIEERKRMQVPPFSVLEITGEEFFYGENLVTGKFADVQKEFARITGIQ